ncbi:MAG: thioesterase family protein [Deltaproteobacteria bacterium]|nr:thioesterase family protein [Deltaproteobacteria bacterium]
MSNPNSIFERDGERLLPTRHALSFWGGDRVHGGAVIGLLAHACESFIQDPAFRISRLTVDLFSPVPAQPLSVRAHRIRDGRRISLVCASLFFDDSELARASALFLRNRGAALTILDTSKPRGPGDLTTTSLFRDVDAADIPPGFHLTVQTRWVPRLKGEPLAIWFRLPVSLVAGVNSSAWVRSAAISDLGNAVATVDAFERESVTAYINVDTTMYFDRDPVGEWFCLRIDRQSEYAGSSIIEISHFDTRGRFARSLQSRISNT